MTPSLRRKADPTLSPCRLCGLAVPPPEIPKPGTSPRAVSGWATCETCANLLAAGGLVALLADLLATPLDPHEPGVTAFATGPDMPAACKMDRFIVPVRTDLPPEMLAKDGPDAAGGGPAPGSGTKYRWDFLDRGARADVAAGLAKAKRRATEPRPHVKGPCGVCGVARSLTWGRTVRLDKPYDGDRWMLCSPCLRAWDRAGASSISDSWQPHLSGLALGVPAVMALPEIQPYAATVTGKATDAPGCSEPFGYIDPDLLDKARRSVWNRNPNTAPPGERERILRRQRAINLLPPRVKPTPLIVLPGPEEPGNGAMIDGRWIPE